MFWQGVFGLLIGLISNVAFILVITVLGLGCQGRDRTAVARLLGVGRTVPPTVKIMVSNIYVVRGGTLGGACAAHRLLRLGDEPERVRLRAAPGGRDPYHSGGQARGQIGPVSA